MGFTDPAEVSTLDSWFGSQVLGPATWHLALLTTGASGAGLGGVEPTGSGYSRLAVTNNFTNFPTGNPKSNGTVLRWATSSGAWGTPVQVAFFTVSSGGIPQALTDIPVGSRQNIDGANQVFEIPIGSLSFTLS